MTSEEKILLVQVSPNPKYFATRFKGRLEFLGTFGANARSGPDANLTSIPCDAQWRKARVKALRMGLGQREMGRQRRSMREGTRKM